MVGIQDWGHGPWNATTTNISQPQKRTEQKKEAVKKII